MRGQPLAIAILALRVALPAPADSPIGNVAADGVARRRLVRYASILHTDCELRRGEASAH